MQVSVKRSTRKIGKKARNVSKIKRLRKQHRKTFKASRKR